ncbi:MULTISPECIES: hypothetical protein [Pseudofrankia]|uniref:hypothetical protein n=1 Tax=Pseudofrankia TaxID=2994363 RepID=UPI000234B3D3|nr:MULTISPECIES: hypothetical protein [Pseudofrankia]OHV39327.1 hypothetical protein BCD49_11605 [Pseudofrankia sp. EUN1h]
MPEANDAELTRVFTASVSAAPAVEDGEPNTAAPGSPAAAQFYLFVEGVAGNVLGNSGANYTLYLDAVAETTGAPALSQFTLAQEFSPTTWVPGGLAGNFVTQQVFTVPVPTGARGHVYRYKARLVGVSNNTVSHSRSNEFVLV